MEEIFKRVERFHSGFLEEIEAAYRRCQDVVNISSWFSRLDELSRALEKGSAAYRQVEDHVFELKVVNYLLETFPGCVIAYEPPGISNHGKNCDLEVTYGSTRYLIEVKCFHPKWKKTVIPAEHIAENNKVIMNGESYHTYQATRGHLLDVTRHAERKLCNYARPFISVLAVPDGFHLNKEDFRDFVHIYRQDHPRADDPLGPMTMHNLGEPFEGLIDQFWAFPFPQLSFSLEAGEVATVVAPLKQHDSQVQLLG